MVFASLCGYTLMLFKLSFLFLLTAIISSISDTIISIFILANYILLTTGISFNEVLVPRKKQMFCVIMAIAQQYYIKLSGVEELVI